MRSCAFSYCIFIFMSFLFMRFVLYAEEDMQPEGLNFRNRVWRSLAKPRPDFPYSW